MTQLALSPNRLPAIASEQGLAAYLAAIRKFPMLSKEEEYQLAKRLEEHGDIEAAHKLVTSHMRLVVKIAMSNRFYGIPLSDLISEGNVGLLRAVKGFEADRGFRLATYAMWWIKAAIYECVLNSWSLVKLGTAHAQKKLFFNLGKLKSKLGVYQDGEIPPAKVDVIAERLHVTPEEIVDMNRRLSGPDKSLNQPVGEFGETTRQDLLIDQAPSQEAVLAENEERALGLRLLKTGLATLNARERAVIEQRRLSENPRTLDDIGADFGVSRERIRQIENRAFQKLQAAVKQNLASLSQQPSTAH
ncbi:MAG: RNA polymerase factor sigma-32 [Rhodospirillaceae bacterium]